MPTNFTGLALFLIALAPGFAYGALRRTRYPERRASGFRETGRIVLTSCVCDGFAVLVFWGLRALAPQHTFNVGALIRAGSPYLQANYQSAAVWGAAMLALAVLAAVVAALVLPRRLGSLSAESSWWFLFDEYPRVNGAASVHVGCELTDGAHISGKLQHYASQPEETQDRELALSAPLRYRPPGTNEEYELTGTAAVSMSAHQVKFLTVTYLKPVPEPPRPATGAELPAAVEDAPEPEPQPSAPRAEEKDPRTEKRVRPQRRRATQMGQQ